MHASLDPSAGSGMVYRHSGSAARALWPECHMAYTREHGHKRCDTREETASMARVLPGTAPHVVAHGQADMRPALAWIEAHAYAFRGQWIAVRLVDPVVVASVPTLTQLWHRASPVLLKDC